MNRDLSIIGDGLAGCTLGLTCFRKKIPFKIISCHQPGEASMASSGLIAPVTGRRYVKAWMIDEFISKALDFYTWSESLLGGKYFFPMEIVRFLSHAEARAAWHKRLDDPEYVLYISNKRYSYLDELDKPYGILTGGYRLETQGWLMAVRKFLTDQGLLEQIAKPFNPDSFGVTTIIYATGAVDPGLAHGVIPNKGEALIVSMQNWKIPLVVKDEVFIVPLQEPQLFWVGSYYQPWPDNPVPSVEGKNQILQSLSKVYSGPVEVIAHFSGVRPTVDDRRPLIGVFPGQQHQYMFNGMGTKGTSLAPYWAEQLLLHVYEGLILPALVSPARYSG